MKRFKLMNDICYEKVMDNAGKNQVIEGTFTLVLLIVAVYAAVNMRKYRGIRVLHSLSMCVSILFRDNTSIAILRLSHFISSPFSDHGRNQIVIKYMCTYIHVRYPTTGAYFLSFAQRNGQNRTSNS